MDANFMKQLGTIFNKWTRDASISKVVKIEKMENTGIEKSFSSSIFKFRVEIILQSGKKMKKYFIVKNLPTDSIKKETIVDFGFFLKEIMVYRDLMPAMEKIMDDKGDTSELVWTKCIDIIPYGTIVLKDLSVKGYEVCRMMDIDHAIMIVKGLAKFHALSIALKEQHCIPLDVFGEGVLEKHKNTLAPEHQKTFENFIKYSKKNWGSKWLAVIEKLEKYAAGNVAEMVLQKIGNRENKFFVLNHGDLWSNNVLFKYKEGTDIPVSMKLIDFQCAVFKSPALDLQYFLSTTTNIELRKNQVKLIHGYHTSLVDNMVYLDCKTLPISFTALLNEVKELHIYGIFIGIIILPILIGQTDNEHNSSEIVKNGDQAMHKLYGGEKYKKCMQYLLKKFDA